MDIQSIDIVYYRFTKTIPMKPNGLLHVKSLPFLSIVQSTVGSYDIQLDDAPMYSTGEGGFFITPSSVRQTILHRYSPVKHMMTARWLFLDAKINGKYSLDECFSFPTIPGPRETQLLNGYFDELTEATDICSAMSILYNIIGVLLRFGTEKQNPDGGVSQVLRYIHGNYKNDISVKNLAEIALMSESNLFAAFRKQYGTSPMEYVTKIRISVAQDLLIETGKSIQEIASEVGFHDPFYFCRVFRNHCGVSPRTFRKRRNENNIENNPVSPLPL